MPNNKSCSSIQLPADQVLEMVGLSIQNVNARLELLLPSAQEKVCEEVNNNWWRKWRKIEYSFEEAILIATQTWPWSDAMFKLYGLESRMAARLQRLEQIAIAANLVPTNQRVKPMMTLSVDDANFLHSWSNDL